MRLLGDSVQRQEGDCGQNSRNNFSEVGRRREAKKRSNKWQLYSITKVTGSLERGFPLGVSRILKA